MKKKYTIRIQRVEYYNYDVEVEAESAADAIREVERREDDGEFMLEDSWFDDVETHVYCTSESEATA